MEKSDVLCKESLIQQCQDARSNLETEIEDYRQLKIDLLSFAEDEELVCRLKGYDMNADPVEFLNQMAEENPALLIDLQLEYIEYTSVVGTDIKRWIETKEYDNPYKLSYEEFITATYSSEEMAIIFMASYERPELENTHRERRMENANKWYEYFKEMN